MFPYVYYVTAPFGHSIRRDLVVNLEKFINICEQININVKGVAADLFIK